MKLFLKKIASLCIGLTASLILIAMEPVDIEVITVSEGLSNNRVNAVYQDSTGFLWIGTDDGLNRYDGYRFQVYRQEAFNDSSISSNIINCITGGNNGALWIGTSDGICRFDRRMNSFERYALPVENAAGTKIVSLVNDPSGIVWVLTEDNLFAFDLYSKKFRNIPLSNNDYKQQLFRSGKMYLDDAGHLWIGTRSGLYVRLYGDSLIRQTTLNTQQINDLKVDSKGRLWLATSNGLLLFNRSLMNWQLFIPPYIGYKAIRGIVELEDDKLQLISDGGMIQFNSDVPLFSKSGDLSLYGRIFDLPQVRSYCLDRSDILWLGTSQGLIRHDFKPKIFNRYSTDETSFPRLLTNRIFGLYKDEKGLIWMGTRNSGLMVMNRETGEVENYSPQGIGKCRKPFVDVMEILPDRYGRIWICSDRICIFDTRTENFIPLYSVLEVPEEAVPDIQRVYDILELDRRVFLIGARNGLWHLDEKNGTFSRDTLLVNDSLQVPLSDVAALETDREGNIWVGCKAGVIRFNSDLSAWKYYPRGKETGLTGNETYCILCDKRGTIWAGTTGGIGEYLPGEDRFRTYTVKDGLPNDFIYSMIEDQHGNIWISTNQGLSMLDRENNILPNAKS